MKSISDNELVYMLREPATRREGFSAMVQQYSEQLYWKVRHIVLTHEDANDVLQNVFLKAWKNLETFQGKSSLSGFLPCNAKINVFLIISIAVVDLGVSSGFSVEKSCCKRSRSAFPDLCLVPLHMVSVSFF